MSLQQSSTRFCLFFYKGISSGGKIRDNLHEIKRFLKILSRLLCTETIDNEFPIKTNHANGLLNCCKECEIIIVSFCELYNQIKCLELKLDAKLDRLVGKVEVSNKIPSRWMNVKKALQLTFQDDINKIHESRDGLIKIRQGVIKSGKYLVSLVKNYQLL